MENSIINTFDKKATFLIVSFDHQSMESKGHGNLSTVDWSLTVTAVQSQIQCRTR